MTAVDLSMTARVNRSPGLTWVFGVLAGVPVGFLVAVLPLVGLIAAGVAALWAAVRRPRIWAISGLLIGAGGAYLLLLARAAASCQTISEPGYLRDCTAPANLAVFQSSAAGLLVAGIALMVFGLWQSFRQH